jgi:pentatricopeptide repeat protein
MTAKPPAPRLPPKLRRKPPTQDTVLKESTAVQRLVDYFVVVTSLPRWETKPADEQPVKGVKRRRRKDAAPTVETRQGGSESARTDGNIHLPLHSTQDHTFQPQITARYPLTDYADSPLNPMILHFCYPAGDVIHPSRSYLLPAVHHFVLTNDKGRKVYGTCLTVYEEYIPTAPFQNTQSMLTEQPDGIVEVTVDKTGKALYLPKVLLLLSTWPYLTAFREYLAQLYRLAVATNVMRAPLERYVVNICREIPAPPPGAYEVQLQILNSTIRVWAPPAKLPIAYTALPYTTLLECLDVENIVTLWSALICERKILLLSSQYSILTVCAEILCSLLFPMKWSHLYVPMLPKMLCPMLDAPMPYLVGIVRGNWLHAQQFLSCDTIVVDLDRNKIQFSVQVPPIPPLPVKKVTKLQNLLTEAVGGVFWRAHGMSKEYEAMMSRKPHKRSIHKLRQTKPSTQWNERLGGLDNAYNLAYTPDSPNLLNDTLPEDEQQKWASVQEAFHQFFVSALKDYRKYLSLPPVTPKPCFNRTDFLSHQKADNFLFLTELCMTQQFDDFLTRIMYSPGEPDLVFFDQSIDAKKNRSKLKFRKVETPFLLNASAHKDLTKFQAVPPNDTGLAQFEEYRRVKPFIYKKWPDTFDESLFTYPRPIPRMITAEFDRQADLVAKLRRAHHHVSHHTTTDHDVNESFDDVDLMEFYGGDYDPSPEVASFTVFFFIYSSLVGREWQRYIQQRREEERRERELKKDVSRSDSEDTAAEEDVRDTRVSEEELAAADACVSDLSLGFCDACPGIKTLQSTVLFMGREAEESYNCLFHKSVEPVHELTAVRSQSLPEQVDASSEEAREVACAQLDLAFQTLSTLSLRGLPADSDGYLSLMEACGRCGDTHDALKLMELMRKDGFVADSEVLASFMAVFAHVGEEGLDIGDPADRVGRSGPDAYSKFLVKQLETSKSEDAGTSIVSTLSSSFLNRDPSEVCLLLDDDGSSECSASRSTTRTPTGGEAFLEWFQYNRSSQAHRNGRRMRKKKSQAAESMLPVSEMVARQLSLGESVLDFVYPDLAIDTNSEACPHCSFVLSESDVVGGWTPCAFQDYTTGCPKCEHRFVPRFIVSTSCADFEGSQGPRTPLYCEFLSPWVVRKELQSVIKGETGIDGMLTPQWRQGTDISATLFWNLMVLFRRYRLPFTFLLQGNFPNRLILPRKPNEM